VTVEALIQKRVDTAAIDAGFDSTEPQPEPISIDTMIVSDIHLGSSLSRAKELLTVLKRYRFNRLILLGDIFVDLNFNRLKNEHWELLSYILKLPTHQQGVEVVWIEGNHDKGISVILGRLVGIKVYQEYVWMQDDKRHLAFHGHQFDRFVSNNEALSDFFSRLYLLIEKMDTKGKFFSHLISKTVHYFQGNTPKLAGGAERLGRMFNAQVVFCGHTHEAFHAAFDCLDYYNTGSWVTSPSTYITITGNRVEIQAHE